MFAIATPQTVTLTIPGDDGPSTLINFRINDADTSRCVLEIVTPEGDTHRLTFNTRGSLVDSQFIDHDSAPEDPNHRPLSAQDYIVDGVDTRAFNPHTFQPPNTVDSAYRPNTAPARPETPEQREIAEKHRSEAADSARKAREEHMAKAAETGEERLAREKTEREDKAKRIEASLDPNAVRTPGLDRQEGLNDPFVIDRTFPEVPASPMAPAPSSGLPGGQLPHPLGQSDPGVVNTTKSMTPA